MVVTKILRGTIRRALVGEAAILHELTGRSAFSWGYEPEFLEWEPQAIAVTPEFIANATVYVLEVHDRILGYYALSGEPSELYLDKLFLEPDRIGTGRGKRLWRHAAIMARGLGATELLIASDPNAAPFYRAMGAVREREETSTRPGWNLQFLRYAFPKADSGGKSQTLS
jgi:GNAT superfamily N-acetyltransferase